jgi:hypothetical protein
MPNKDKNQQQPSQSDHSAARSSRKAPTKKTAGVAKKAAAKKVIKKASSAGRTSVASKTAPRQRRSKRPLPAPKSGVLPGRHEALVADALQAMAPPQLPQPAQQGDVINLGVIAGTGLPPGSVGPTMALGAGGTDLCEISPGGEVALAGDTLSANRARQGDWSPSMGLHVRPGTLNGNIQFDSAFGGRGTLYAETNHPAGGSQLPAGTVQVFGREYALVTRVVNLIPVDSRLVRIDPHRAGWPTVPGSWPPAEWQDGTKRRSAATRKPTAGCTSSPTGSRAITR